MCVWNTLDTAAAFEARCTLSRFTALFLSCPACLHPTTRLSVGFPLRNPFPIRNVSCSHFLARCYVPAVHLRRAVSSSARLGAVHLATAPNSANRADSQLPQPSYSRRTCSRLLGGSSVPGQLSPTIPLPGPGSARFRNRMERTSCVNEIKFDLQVTLPSKLQTPSCFSFLQDM